MGYVTDPPQRRPGTAPVAGNLRAVGNLPGAYLVLPRAGLVLGGVHDRVDPVGLFRYFLHLGKSGRERSRAGLDLVTAQRAVGRVRQGVVTVHSASSSRKSSSRRCCLSILWRSLARPSLVFDAIVPGLTPRICAVSTPLKPRRCRSTTALRCLGGSLPR